MAMEGAEPISDRGTFELIATERKGVAPSSGFACMYRLSQPSLRLLMPGAPHSI